MNSILRLTAYKIYKLGGWLTIGLAALLITLRLVGAYFAPTETDLIQWAKKTFPYALNIKSAQVTFVGWDPVVTLHDVDILSDEDRLALNIEEVNVVFNLYALLFKKVELRDVVLKGMKVSIEYQSDGTIAISDLSTLKWNSKQSSSKRLSVKHLVIEDSDIHLILGPGKSLPLAQVDLRMDSGLRFNLSGHAHVVNDVPSTIKFVFDLPLFTNHAAEFFCDWQGVKLSQVSALIGETLPIVPVAGAVDLKAWLSIDKHGKKKLISEFQFSEGELKTDRGTKSFQPFSGWLDAEGEDRNWNTQSSWKQANSDPYEFIVNTYHCEESQCLDIRAMDLNLERTVGLFQKYDLVPNRFESLLADNSIKGLLDSLTIHFHLTR